MESTVIDISDDDANFSDFEIDEPEDQDKAYNELRNGVHTVKTSDRTFCCPYCPGKRKDFLYKDLLQHASGRGNSSSTKRSNEDKENHLALARYLENDLPKEAFSSEDNDDPPKGSDCEEKFVWPWRGVVANLPTVCIDGRNVGGSGSKLRYELMSRGFNPIRVHPLWNFLGHSGFAVVEFNKDWDGLHHAMLMEKAYALGNHGKREWKSCGGNGSGIYSWVARADDYTDTGIIGDHLRKVGDLKSIADITKEEDQKTCRLVTDLSNAIESKNKDFEKIEAKIIETSVSLDKVLIEKDALLKYYEEDLRKLQLSARCQLQRIFDSHEKLKQELESQRKYAEMHIAELEKREARNESDRKMLIEEIEKNVLKNSELELAALEQTKSDENVMKLAEDQKREKTKLHKRIIELEKQLDRKQALELEIERLKGKLSVTTQIVGEGDTKVMNKMKEMLENLREKQAELEHLEQLNQTLLVKERSSNDELQEARKEVIEELKKTPNEGQIRIKRMGELDDEPFYKAATRKFGPLEAEEKAVELSSLWDEYLRDPGWHPFKVVQIPGEPAQEVIDDDDEKLKELRSEYGDDVFRSVVRSLLETNAYNPSGRYTISEIWNYNEGRRATLEEVILYLLNSRDSCKRRRM